MKVTLSLLVVLAWASATLGLPASSPKQITEEIEIVPLERHPYGDQPIIDTGIIGGFEAPSYNPFSGLFGNLEGIMTRMRQQMESLLKRFPDTKVNNSEEVPDFPVGAELPAFQFGDIDLGKGNSTSVTKVIDGHKVVINETEYRKEDDFGGAFFKVRIIDVKPDSSEVTTERNVEEDAVATIPAVKDRESVESVESSVENEIPKSREAASFDNIETFDEVDEPFQKFTSNDRNTEWNDVRPVEIFEGNTLDFEDRSRPIDLSGDIRVNQIMADAGAPMNPEAEFIYDIVEPQKFRKNISPR